MQLIVSHRLFQIGAMLLIFTAIGTGVVCQFYTDPIDYEYAPSSKHQSAPSVHSMLDVSCLAAVLPSIMFFPSLFCFLFYARPLLLKRATPASPPFKPPKGHLC